MRIITFVASVCGVVLAGGALASPKGHNGTWSVRLVTEAGSCGGAFTTSVIVEGGQVRALSNADGASVSGGIGGDGSVALGIKRSIASGEASGRLAGRAGAGTWRVAMLGCSGRWTASRVTQTAEN